MKLQLTNEKLINELKKYSKDAKVNLSVIVNSKTLMDENELSVEKGMYFVDGVVIDVSESLENSDDPTIMALDINYGGR